MGEEDYAVVEGKLIGRISRDRVPGGETKWRWFLQSESVVPPPNSGEADTLEEAKAALAERYRGDARLPAARKVLLPGLRELLVDMRASMETGNHKQFLARLDNELSFGDYGPVVQAIFNFMLARTPAQHRREAKRLRRMKYPDSQEIAEFHEVFVAMLE